MKLSRISTIVILIVLLGCDEKAPASLDTASAPQKTCAPITTDKAWYTSDQAAPLLEGLDVLSFPVSTENKLAQKYFDQGLVLSYGFNHAEAARSFHYAARLDPDCAMAYWGFAYVLGPNYNAGMEDDNYQRAYQAIQRAVELSESNCTDKEKELIHAMAKRYAPEAPQDRSELDQAYADALKQVRNHFPNDPDIGTLYAESLMNLYPWDLWDKAGNIKEWTPTILATLDQVLDKNPKHPGAHHLYIHAVEASNQPEKGLASAKLFDEGLVPGSGHLIHMPSHIYIRTGDYHKGTLANIKAVEVDSTYLTACHAHGAYPLAYYPHNDHFLAATASLEGNSYWAIKSSKRMAAGVNRQLMEEPGWGTAQHYYTIPYYVFVKFGKWQEILAMPAEDSALIYPQAIRHYARGMAFWGINDLESAGKELAAMKKLTEDESLKEVTIWDINSVYTLLQIAQRVLAGEILASEGKFEESVSILMEAVSLEDGLNYNEPPDWFFSVRHHLGAVLLEAGRAEDAIVTFEADLDRLPKNGWAMHGMLAAYADLEDTQKMAEIKKRLEVAWAHADISLSTSRTK
jgi:tetratricopeptide (TPR) repeat protein